MAVYPGDQTRKGGAVKHVSGPCCEMRQSRGLRKRRLNIAAVAVRSIFGGLHTPHFEYEERHGESGSSEKTLSILEAVRTWSIIGTSIYLGLTL